MLVSVLHGGNKLDIHSGYKQPKAKRQLYGVGLYTTDNIHWATNFGRTLYRLTLDIENKNASHNVVISKDLVLEFIYNNCTKKLFQQAKKDFKYHEFLTCERLELYLTNNIKNLANIALDLCNFFVLVGCTHSIEIAGSFNAQLIKVYDFNCIKEVEKVTQNYNNTIIPDSIQRDYKRIA